MSFMIYDLSFLVIFLIVVSIFLYRGKKNLKKEGWLLLYRTTWGIKLINHVGKKYKKSLKILSYISVILGYILMILILYFLGQIVWTYLFDYGIVQDLKVPPIMPLIPYLPQLFNLSFLPPFYFTYWILIIAIIAITHEFAHGIFAARNKVKIKTTGFGFFPFFLPIFLAAFVELDEKQMAKKKPFSQLATLSAGTFANTLTAILFLGILALFFSLAFAPTGVTFDYAYYPVEIANITSINGIALQNPSYDRFIELVNTSGVNDIEADEEKYVGIKGFFKNNKEYIMLYKAGPAINSQLEQVIFKLNDVEVNSIEKLTEELSKYSPGDKVTFNVLGDDGEDYNKDVILETHPEDEDKAWLGIVLPSKSDDASIIRKSIIWVTSFKKPGIYYEPKIDGVSVFIYHLLWWVAIISISVALINMLPVGIFDGGRFFYLTVLALTKSEKKAKKSFVFMTKLIGFLVLLLMVVWAYRIFWPL